MTVVSRVARCAIDIFFDPEEGLSFDGTPKRVAVRHGEAVIYHKLSLLKLLITATRELHLFHFAEFYGQIASRR